MTTAPMFSVVIPTYNRADLLSRTLDSVFRQEERDFELIVVDDGSTDGTWSLLQAHADRLTALRQDNSGPSAARNRGIDRARGRYVVALDSDDLWFPWSLAKFREAIERTRAPVMLTGTWREFQEESDLSAVQREPLDVEVFDSYHATCGRRIHVSSGVSAYERRRLGDVGGFDPGMTNAEDHDLALRLGALGPFALIQRPILIGYRQHPGSIRDAEATSRALLECVARSRRGAYPGPSRAVGELLTLHTRPASLACLAAGRPDLAWSLYKRTLTLNLREGRLRYVFGFPLVSLLRTAATIKT